ncbi:MAG TPA: hypothetical protein VF290_20845 [Pyrinomonadaceae bacterium]
MTPPPNPALRKLWIDAAAASHTMRRISMLEQTWVSLLVSTSELPIFHAEESIDSLVKFTTFEIRLVEAMAHAGLNARDEDAAALQAETRSPLFAAETRSPVSVVEIPSPHSAADTGSPSFAGETKGDDDRQKNTVTTEAGIYALETGPEPKPDRGKSSRPTIKTNPAAVDEKVAALNPASLITRWKSRDHFVTRFEQAGLRLAWDNSVVTIADALAPALGVEQGEAVRSNQPLQTTQVTPDTNQSVPEFATRSGQKSQWRLPLTNLSTPRRIDPVLPLANAPDHPEIFLTTSSRGTHRVVTPVRNPLEHILGPAVERFVRSPQQRLRPKEVAPQRSSEHSWSPGIHERKSGESFPLSGLRRLAAEAENSANVVVDKNKRSSPLPDQDSDVLTRASYPTANEGLDFAAQLTSLLRQETLRHGIDVEEHQG